MEMRVLGRTGLHIGKLAFGTGMFGYFGTPEQSACSRMVARAIEAGINYFDSADVYSHGEAETLLGKALAGRRQDVILATKCGLAMGGADPNMRGNSRRWIMQAAENSLRRLGTDYIDLLQLHRPDDATDIDESLGALSDLVRQGKVRYIGTSSFPPEQLVEAQWVAGTRGRERFRTEQAAYSIFVRRIEADVLPLCRRHGIGVLAWSPLAQGWLSGKWRKGARPADTRRNDLQPHLYDMARADNQRKLDAIEKLEAVAAEAGITLLQMAIAFSTAHPGISAAIIGPRTLEQLEGLLAASEIELGDEVLDAIDAIVPPGTNLSRDDDAYTPPDLADKALRRRRGKEAVHDNFRQQMENIERLRSEAKS